MKSVAIDKAKKRNWGTAMRHRENSKVLGPLNRLDQRVLTPLNFPVTSAAGRFYNARAQGCKDAMVTERKE
jgi:hypothetical protein